MSLAGIYFKSRGGTHQGEPIATAALGASSTLFQKLFSEDGIAVGILDNLLKFSMDLLEHANYCIYQINVPKSN